MSVEKYQWLCRKRFVAGLCRYS